MNEKSVYVEEPEVTLSFQHFLLHYSEILFDFLEPEVSISSNTSFFIPRVFWRALVVVIVPLRVMYSTSVVILNSKVIN